ncbi:MAG: choice-of-anchor P family protein [Acidimicrobiales bacterium]
MDESRRSFIRRSAIAGGAAWAAPAVVSLSSAGAQVGTPRPCPCTADAFGLRVVIPPLGIDETFGVGGCVADTGVVGVPGTATVSAQVVCGDATTGDVCTGAASIADLGVVVGPELLPTLTVDATIIESSASAACDPCSTTGSSSIASLTVNGIAVDVTGACNLDVLDLGLVFVNEQTCTGDTLEVNAIHILVPDIVEVVVAHSEAGGAGCCTACAA